MLWSLVVDDFLTDLVANGFEVIGFVDDVVIIVREKHGSITSNRMQSALILSILVTYTKKDISTGKIQQIVAFSMRIYYRFYT